MINLIYLSGEGPSDLAACNSFNSENNSCTGLGLTLGPMGELLLKQLTCTDYHEVTWISDAINASLPYVQFVYFSRGVLSDYVKEHKLKNTFRPSKVIPKGLAANAMLSFTLGLLAKDGKANLAVVFHDVDGTRSERDANPRIYEDLRDAFGIGFGGAKFDYGVAMVPNPKSEAWLVCAKSGHKNGDHWENSLSGNDRSPKRAAKDVLTELLGKEATTAVQSDFVRDHVDPNLLCVMRSYKDFAENLKNAVLNCAGVPTVS